MKYFNHHFLEQLAQGQLSTEEHKIFKRWLIDADKKTQQKWLNTFEEVQRKNINIDKTPEMKPPVFQNHRTKQIRWLSAASIVIACFSIAIVYFLSQPPASIQYFSGADQSNVLLSDGTKVFIYPNSRISVLYTKKDRQIELEGEASFKVKADKARPLVVKTEAVSTTVLGTEFSIKQSTKGIKVGLHEGSISIKRGEYQKILEPKQQWLWNRKTDNALVLNYQDHSLKKIRFENKPLVKILEFLEWKYDVAIEFEKSEYQNCSISITIGEMTFTEVKEVISFVNNISFKRIAENEYLLSGDCN